MMKPLNEKRTSSHFNYLTLSMFLSFKRIKFDISKWKFGSNGSETFICSVKVHHKKSWAKAAVILCFISTSCLTRLRWSPRRPTLSSESCSLTFFFFLLLRTIIIDLFASLVAGKKQPTGLSNGRNSPSKRHLDDTVPWHSLDICSSLWTENESATDDISHYNKAVTAPLWCTSLFQLHSILHR